METVAVTEMSTALQRELWTSFVSVLRSYLAAHTLHRSEQAILELGAAGLLVRVGARTLRVEYPALDDDPARVQRVGGSAPAFGTWQREAGPSVPFHFDEHGRIVEGGHPEEMDMVAERLAREIATQ